MSKFIQSRDVVLCDDHINEKLDGCLHCRIAELEAERDSHAIANVNANCTIAELKDNLKRVEELPRMDVLQESADLKTGIVEVVLVSDIQEAMS